jgi:hypothetical protein
MSRLKKRKTDYYVYFLRRPDKEDPLDPGKFQPFYIGKGVKDRKLMHRKQAKNTLTSLNKKVLRISIIHELWSKGLDFIVDVIFDNLTEQKAFEIEISFISSYGRIDIGTGILTNLTDGGGGLTGLVFTKEIRKKLSEQKLGTKNPMNNPKYRAKVGRTWTEEEKEHHRLINTGRKVSDETREKISKAGKGKAKTLGMKHSEETKKKMRLNNSGEKNPFYGKTHSEETKQKWLGRKTGNGQGFLGKKHSPETKEKMSLARRGKPSNSKGYKFTDEQRQRMSLSIKKHWETRREIIKW